MQGVQSEPFDHLKIIDEDLFMRCQQTVKARSAKKYDGEPVVFRTDTRSLLTGIKALNILAKERDLIIAGFEEIRDTAFSTEALEAEAEVLTGEVNTVAELIQKCIDENARVAQDQSEYQKRYDALVQRFETAKAKLDEAQAAIAKTKAQCQMMENFIETLRSLPEQVEIFDEGTWYALCDYITVYSKDDIRVTFQNGTEIPV